MAFRWRRLRAHRWLHDIAGPLRATAPAAPSGRRRSRPGAASLHLERLEPRLVLAANFVISEFLADNGGSLVDNYGAESDWIEIQNNGDAPGNLGGHYLTDDSGQLAKWQFPSVNVPAGGFVVVFASGMDDRDPLQPLHSNFSLAKEGEYLALVAPNGTSVLSAFTPQYGPQREDISQGVGQVVDTVTYVGPAAQARTLVPTSATHPTSWLQPSFVPDASWAAGTTGVGYGESFNGFLVRTYRANTASNSPVGTSVDNIDEALEVVGNPAAYTSVAAGNYGTVNFVNTGSGGRYAGSVAYPGLNTTTDFNNIVTEAHARITIPAAGPWTFGVSSNEGFLLQIGEEFELERTGTGDAEQFATFNFAAAGTYDLHLFNFERTGSTWLELYAAPGTHATWSAAPFDLVGDVAGGGLAVKSSLVAAAGGSIGQLVGADLTSVMKDVNSSFYTRITFNSAGPGSFDQLKLRMKYDDGFVAYLNGVEVARRNFVGQPQWNSLASSNRTGDEPLSYEDIDITPFLGSLLVGQNVLAIQGINFSASDLDALVLPELIATDVQPTGHAYFTTPTPGAANGAGVAGFVGEPTFSVDRGFYNAAFQLTLASPTAGSQVYYTTNGDAPTQATGILYAGPINVSKTTVLRAAAFRSGYLPSASVSATYLFLNDIVRQTSAATIAAGLPPTWGSVTPDYGLDPTVVGTFDANGNPLGGDSYGGIYAATLKNDLLSIPTLSIVLDVDDMFGASGIYSNSSQRGIAWERATSVEWITNDGSPEFQVNAGIRIQGGAFRSDGLTKKHSLRLLFKNEYGPGKLEFPLFADEDAVEEFNTLTLRAGANDGYTWASARNTEQYIRDEFGRSLQRASGSPSPHGEFAHLYINGIYWGLYNPVERPDNEFAASYLGGDPDNWDTIHDADAPNGDFVAWNAMFAKAQQAGSSLAAYMELQGKNLDGTPSPSTPPLLDVLNYIDYIAINAWGGNWDWPRKNFWAGRDRDPATTEGFQFFNWDFENTMGNNRSRSPLTRDVFNPAEIPSPWFTGPNNAGQPHLYLASSPEYQLAFADRVHRMFFNDGILTPQQLAVRYTAIAAGVERAIVAESARWGDSHAEPPLTLTEWRTERDYILNTYLPQRTAIVLDDLKGYGLYPTLAAPSFSQHGGQVTPGFDVTITAPSGAIWYTLDGSDPRQIGGAVSPSALQYTGAAVDIPAGLVLRARTLSGTTWSALNEAEFSVAAPAGPTNLRIVELHYNPAMQSGVADDGDLEFIELLNPSATPVSLDGVQLTQFSNTAYAFPNGIVLNAGQRLVVARSPSVLQAMYGAGINVAAAGYWDQNLSNSGETVALVGPSGTIQTIVYQDDPPWPAAADGQGKSLEIINPLGNVSDPANWRASYYRGGSPGTDGAAPARAGDFDGDGDVDGNDFLVWQRGKGTPQLQGSASKGDADGDRDVDAADLSVVRFSFGAGTAAAALEASVIPSSAASSSSLRLAAGAPLADAVLANATLADGEWIVADSASSAPWSPEGVRRRDPAGSSEPIAVEDRPAWRPPGIAATGRWRTASTAASHTAESAARDVVFSRVGQIIDDDALAGLSG